MTDYRMTSIAVSQGCEIARWTMERAGLSFREQFNAPLLHIPSTLWEGFALEAPVVRGPGGLWRSLFRIILGIDSAAPPDRNIFGSGTSERLANQTLLFATSPEFGPVRGYVYSFVVPDRPLLTRLATAGVPHWQRRFVEDRFALYDKLLRWGLGIKDSTRTDAPPKINRGLDAIDAELGRRGTDYLAGGEPGGIDCAVAAVLGPLVFPAEYGGLLPGLAECPDELQAFVHGVRARPCGALALEVYRTQRHRRPLSFETVNAPES
jgi:glutathione S-transferase